jgi:hypothetical protein
MAAIEAASELIADLAKVIGLPEIPPDDNGGYHLTIGDDNDVFIYPVDADRILLVVPIAPLPLHPQYAVMNYLLRSNLFDSDLAPFQIATDDNSMLIQWGRLNIADFDGTLLAKAIDNLAQRATAIRAELGPDT